jgi:hypothetical protein
MLNRQKHFLLERAVSICGSVLEGEMSQLREDVQTQDSPLTVIVKSYTFM